MATSPVALLDSDVLIDILRQHPAAHLWLQANSTPLFIHGVVAMEIIVGSRNKGDLLKNQQLLSRFNIVWPTPLEFQTAYDLLATYSLATSMGIPDALIAATALTRQWALYTFNLKHYRQIPHLEVKIPYTR